MTTGNRMSANRHSRGIRNVSGNRIDQLKITLHNQDLPDGYDTGSIIAVDTETMGLDVYRDRLCLVQVSKGDGNADLVKIEQGQKSAPNLEKLLSDGDVLKLFHYARADMGVLKQWLGISVSPVYCTKIASRFARTNSSQHGLKALVQEIVEIEIPKEQQSSDWADPDLTDEQIAYAASDVLYLHKLREALNGRLNRDGRFDLAQKCFDFLPHRVEMDLRGWKIDIFSH